MWPQVQGALMYTESNKSKNERITTVFWIKMFGPLKKTLQKHGNFILQI